MKLIHSFGLVAFGLATLVGCGSSDEDEDSGGPVASTPLKGVVAGKEFVAKSAIARPGFSDEGDERMVSIYDVDADCSSGGGDTSLLTSVEWKSGVAKNLSFSLGGDSQTVTFVVGPGQNVISSTGRIEVIDAPTEANAKGKIRIRAKADSDHVEGEIDVLVCDR